MTNDKKKIMVLAALGLVLVAVGAFSFMGGGSPPAPTTAASKTDATGDAAKQVAEKEELTPEQQKNQELMAMLQGELSQRDPFERPADAKPVEPINTSKPPVIPQTSPRGGNAGGRRSGGGSIPPFDPMGGRLPSGGGLPSPGGGIGLEQGAPLRHPDDPGYRVKGVITGRKPMAVFEDESGNQKLVPIGGSLDGDTQVTGIEKGKVRVRHRGKDKTLDLEEGSK